VLDATMVINGEKIWNHLLGDYMWLAHAQAYGQAARGIVCSWCRPIRPALHVIPSRRCMMGVLPYVFDNVR